MENVNRVDRKEYRRRWMRDWRRTNGLVLSPEEKQKRKRESHQRAVETSRRKWNSPEGKLAAKYRMLRHRYKIDKPAVDCLNLIVACPICLQPFSSTILSEKTRKRGMPHVDHNHKTGKVRGVLCGYCNVFVGKIEKAISNGQMAKIKAWISL
jgi:hypothetical protein